LTKILIDSDNIHAPKTIFFVLETSFGINIAVDCEIDHQESNYLGIWQKIKS
jgi:hypothetical protein